MLKNKSLDVEYHSKLEKSKCRYIIIDSFGKMEEFFIDNEKRLEMSAQFDMRHRSRVLVDGPDRDAARSQLHSVGYNVDDLKKPLVMVAHEWIGTMPCTNSQRELAQHVMSGIREAGGTPMEVNTIAISDGISMGTEGMKASLISREVIADSIELCGVGYSFDALVIIVGCDKTIPAGAMALARLLSLIHI